MPRSTNDRQGALRVGGRGGSTREWRRIRQRILDRDNRECAYCGAEANTVDHIVPWSKGGTDQADNLVAACRNCNIAKGARSLEFLRGSATHPTPLPPPSPRGTVMTHRSHI